MTVNEKLNKILATELEVDVNFLSNDKTVNVLCDESIIGTSEELIVVRDFLTPSVCRSITIILAIEEEFEIEIKDEEVNDIFDNNWTIANLIEFIEKKISKSGGLQTI